MKKLSSFVVAVLCMFNAVYGQGIDFFHGTFEEALKAAKEQNKLIFMDAFTSWCGPCKMMSSQTFKDEKVGEFFNQNFINIKVDMEKGEGPTLSSKYTVTAYPTLLFIDGEGKLSYKELGFKTPDAFLKTGEAALRSNDKSGEFKKKYDAGDHSPELLRQYAAALLQSKSDYLKVANEYVATQKDMTTAENLLFVFDFANYSDSKIFDLLIQHRDLIEKQKSSELIDAKIETACRNTVKRAIEFRSEDLLTQAKATMKSHLKSKSKVFAIESDMNYYRESGESKKYVSAANKYVKKVVKKNDTKLFEMARQVTYNSSDPAAMKSATKWAKKALKIGNRYDQAHLYAYLLAQTGKTKEALKVAERALLLGEQQNIIPTATKQLIEQLKKK